GSIPTEGKNSTREGGGEDREVAVPGSPKLVGPVLLHESPKSETSSGGCGSLKEFPPRDSQYRELSAIASLLGAGFQKALQ
ncbi:hypothetical protein L195_g048802, partial [Trifolium pratense]